jgi:hypothetical protein
VTVSNRMRSKLVETALTLVLVACGDHGTEPRTPAPTTSDLPALALAPEHPTYALGVAHARTLLAYAPTFVSALPGLDPEASAAVYSNHLDPTLVLHLADPAAARAAMGPPSQTAGADNWEIVDNWLLLHLQLFGDEPNAGYWLPDAHGLASDLWAWAKQHAGSASGAIGFIDVHALALRFPTLAARLPRLGAAVACVQLAEPLGRVALSIDANPAHLAVHATVDVGTASTSVSSSILPPPPGWAATAKGAPIAAQLNVDLQAVAAWIAPCTQALAIDHVFGKAGVRAARAMLQTIDISKPSGTGAIALDLERKDSLASLLDRIPMRSTLESNRTFGGHAGHHIDIPFTATLDYVLEDHLALAAVGDGLLDRITAAPPDGATPAPPLFAVDVWPSKLPHEAWQAVAQLVHLPEVLAGSIAALNELQASLSLTGSTLALDVSLNP